MGLLRLFGTDIEAAIRKLDELAVWYQLRRSWSRTWVHCAVDDLPVELRERAAEIAIDEHRRNTPLGRMNDDGTFSPSYQ
jgi:hypothetical protein